LVEHGDVTALSIYANKLKQSSHRDVLHGDIKEVSLVLAGANPEAFIDSIMMHGEELVYSEDEAIVYFPEKITLSHAQEDETEENSEEMNENEETVQDVFNTLTDKQKKCVYAIIGNALKNSSQ